VYYIHSVVVQDFVSGWACCVNKYHYESLSRRVVMRLVHATGKTWYKVLYQHTIYVINLSNISIKTNFKQIARVELKCVQYSEGDYILCMTSLFFSVHSPMSGYCILSYIPMVWRHVKVLRQRMSHATLCHSSITTVCGDTTSCIRQRLSLISMENAHQGPTI
jgi:hypothetical protein